MAYHKLALVQINWQDALYEGLERDERFHVIMRAQNRIEGRWKEDYNVANNYCPRHTHYTSSPWQLACAILGWVYNSELDN